MTPQAVPPGYEDAPPALPPMTHEEASWHTHMASMRATTTDTAAASPARTLAAASVAKDTRHGIEFPPLTAGCLLAIQGASRLVQDAGMRLDGAEEVAVMVYCLARGEEAFALTESGNLPTLLREARLMLAPVPIAEIPHLTEYIRASIALATGQPATPSPEQKKTGE